MAPHRDMARRAAGDQLSLAAVRRGVDQLRRVAQRFHPVGLNHRVDHKGRAGLALAPAAMAAIGEQRLAMHPVADAAAGTAAVGVWLMGGFGHL